MHPVCAWLSTQFAMPTGSRTQSVRSLSRHSPYASSLPYIQLRARLSLDVWHPVCAWLIAYAQKKHRFSGAFNIFIPSKLNKRKRTSHCRALAACRTGILRFAAVPELRISSRPISTRQLHALPHFHLAPIHLVVFKGSCDVSSWGGLHA